MRKICIFCGAEIASGVNICRRCNDYKGVVDAKECPNCGDLIAFDEKSCVNCDWHEGVPFVEPPSIPANIRR